MPHCRFCLGLFFFVVAVHLRVSEMHTLESCTQGPFNHLQQIACFTRCAPPQYFIANELRQGVGVHADGRQFCLLPGLARHKQLLNWNQFSFIMVSYLSYKQDTSWLELSSTLAELLRFWTEIRCWFGLNIWFSLLIHLDLCKRNKQMAGWLMCFRYVCWCRQHKRHWFWTNGFFLHSMEKTCSSHFYSLTSVYWYTKNILPV